MKTFILVSVLCAFFAPVLASAGKIVACKDVSNSTRKAITPGEKSEAASERKGVGAVTF